MSESTTSSCALNADDCGTGNTYNPTARPGTGQAIPINSGPTVSDVLNALANYIEFSHLAQSLRSRIELITTLEVGFNNFKELVVTDNSVMAQELMGIRDDLTNAIAYINQTLNIEVNERQALVTSVNQLVAAIDENLSAAIQTEATVRAEQTGALFAEQTIKIDLSGNVSGYGLSAYVDPSGSTESEFRVAADRFSIAPPAFTSPTPPPANSLFDGKLWVDSSAGNTPKWWNAEENRWQTTPVPAAQPFVYLSTPLTLPDGTVVPPGLYVNSARITKLTADQIDTRGLTIKDENGNLLFGGGKDLSAENISGLGILATANSATIGSTVKFPNGTVLNTDDFVNALSKIDSNTISTFIESGAIGNAYIGNAAIKTANIDDLAVTSAKIKDLSVETLKIANNAVTIPVAAYTAGTSTSPTTTSGTWVTVQTVSIDGQNSTVYVNYFIGKYSTGEEVFGDNQQPMPLQVRLVDVTGGITRVLYGPADIPAGSWVGTLSAGTRRLEVQMLQSGNAGVKINFGQRTLFALAVKR